MKEKLGTYRINIYKYSDHEFQAWAENSSGEEEMVGYGPTKIEALRNLIEEIALQDQMK